MRHIRSRTEIGDPSRTISSCSCDLLLRVGVLDPHHPERPRLAHRARKPTPRLGRHRRVDERDRDAEQVGERGGDHSRPTRSTGEAARRLAPARVDTRYAASRSRVVSTPGPSARRAARFPVTIDEAISRLPRQASPQRGRPRAWAACPSVRRRRRARQRRLPAPRSRVAPPRRAPRPGRAPARRRSAPAVSCSETRRATQPAPRRPPRRGRAADRGAPPRTPPPQPPPASPASPARP